MSPHPIAIITFPTSTLHPTITHTALPHKALNPTEEASHTSRTSWRLIIGLFIAFVACGSLSGIYILSIRVRVCMKRHAGRAARDARETRMQRTRRASLALSDVTDTDVLEIQDLAVVSASYQTGMRGDRWWMGQYEGGPYERTPTHEWVWTGDDRRRLRRGRGAIGLRRSGSVATLPRYEVRDSGMWKVPEYEEWERGCAGGDEGRAEAGQGGKCRARARKGHGWKG